MIIIPTFQMSRLNSQMLTPFRRHAVDSQVCWTSVLFTDCLQDLKSCGLLAVGTFSLKLTLGAVQGTLSPFAPTASCLLSCRVGSVIPTLKVILFPMTGKENT